MRRTLVIVVYMFAAAALCRAQANDGLFNRLQGFANGEFKFFNTDGIEIACYTGEGRIYSEVDR